MLFLVIKLISEIMGNMAKRETHKFRNRLHLKCVSICHCTNCELLAGNADK